MLFSDLAQLRLHNQQLIAPQVTSAKELVAWMGAMQAQDYSMVKWALGVRLPDSSEASVEAALDRGEIIRTHLLRPTWHLATADDLPWMLALTAPRIRAAMKSRLAQLELSEKVIAKSNRLLEKALRNGRHLTRDAVRAEFNKAGIATHENRASHLLACAELDGVICSGATQNGKTTYALLAERVPAAKPLTKEAALARLAEQYFLSHGPATVADFVWWSGLTAGAAKQALEMVKPKLTSATIQAQTYWFAQSATALETKRDRVYLLPAYDEFTISYKDRSASLAATDNARAMSSNGIFWPIIVVNGQVVGLWKRSAPKGQVIVETEFFKPPTKKILGLVEEAASGYKRFLGKP